MSGRLHLVKMHGAKNDFVLLDERSSAPNAQDARPDVLSYGDLAKRLCDRRTGIGADGLLVVRNASGYSAQMRVYNADGGEAEMCGNGVRCVARYLAERDGGTHFTIQTLAGPIEASIVAAVPEYLVRIDVGVPSFPEGEHGASIVAAGRTWRFLLVSLGNPHVVIFVDDIEAVDFVRLGSEVAMHPRFPKQANVHIAQVLDRHVLRVLHYERGVGLTQACGTGAVACAVAALIERRCDLPVTVRVPGGTLGVHWQRGGHAHLVGPAMMVFEVTLDLASA